MDLFLCGFNGFHELEELIQDQIRLDNEAVTKPLKILHQETVSKVVSTCTWSKIYISVDGSWSSNKGLKAISPGQLSCTWSVVLAVSTEDEIFINDENSIDNDWKKCFVDVRIKVKAVDGGESTFYILYDDGKLGRLIISSDRPTPEFPCLTLATIPLSVSAVGVSCGKEHVLVLTTTGCVYSFGLGSRGQLGHGSVDEEVEPRLIEALEGVHVTSVAAGGWHSTAVTADGDLYVWGWNESGQLGLRHSALEASDINTTDAVRSCSLLALPEPAVVSGDALVIKTSCGSRHTAAITDQHQLFTTGWNKYDQLCLGDVQSRATFTHVESFSCCRVQDVYCGYWNTICVTESKLG